MNNTFFAENVKYLRENRKLKKADMLSAIGFKATTWGNYESGVSVPSLDDLGKISNYFEVLESDLLRIDLSKFNYFELSERFKSLSVPLKNDDTPPPKSNNAVISESNSLIPPLSNGYKLRPKLHATLHPTLKNDVSGNILKEPETPYNKPQIPSIITVNEHGIDNIVYVPVKAQAGYLNGFGDQEFISELPTFRMPGLSNSTYRMFEVEGLSMSPTLSDRDRVICEWVPSISEIRENRVHVVVTQDGVAIKRVLNRSVQRGKIYLKSDTISHRADYPIKEIEPSEILELWYVRMKVSSDLSEPSELYTRVADLELNQHEIMKALGISKP